LTCGCQVSYSQ